LAREFFGIFQIFWIFSPVIVSRIQYLYKHVLSIINICFAIDLFEWFHSISI